MSTGVAEMKARLARIRSRGYWRVILHPTEFDQHRIPSLDRCWEVVESARVNLRWSLVYPTDPPEERVQGNDWIQSGAEWYGPELWRLYQSGQFVHDFAVFEDWVGEDGLDMPQNGTSIKPVRTMNTFNALYTLTEMLEFARRLAYREALSPIASITIELHNMQDRQLVPSKGQMRFGVYKAYDTKISWTKILPSAELIANASELALDATMHIFQRFNWHQPPRHLFAQEQRRLYERQI
jgi:hypothetical protein